MIPRTDSEDGQGFRGRAHKAYVLTSWIGSPQRRPGWWGRPWTPHPPPRCRPRAGLTRIGSGQVIGAALRTSADPQAFRRPAGTTRRRPGSGPQWVGYLRPEPSPARGSAGVAGVVTTAMVLNLALLGSVWLTGLTAVHCVPPQPLRRCRCALRAAAQTAQRRPRTSPQVDLQPAPQ